MSTLNIVNYAILDEGGVQTVAKQGAFADSELTAFTVTGATITGNRIPRRFTLATAAVAKIFDSAFDTPSTFDYAHFVSDVDMYLQIINSANNVIFKVMAKVPFVIPGYGSLVAAAATTAIAGNSEPTVAAVAKIYAGNYSGGPGIGVLTIID